MDMPPSGWYPDPYGVPGLLRWWDGSGWTGHTHVEVTPAGTDAATSQPAVTAIQPAIREAQDAQPTAVQPTTVQPVGVRPGAQLGALQPPAGPPTTPQPAIPADMDPGADGTRVLFLDDSAWTDPGAGQPGARSRAAGDERHRRSRRRRRALVTTGLVSGVAAALAVIALIVNSLGQSGGTPAAATAPTAGAAVSAPASPTPSSPPTPTASPSATSMATVTDSTSGLTYDQLSAPFAGGCPASMSSPSFTWTAGESATAGQVNNGQTTWYGVACSGQLPAQYGYNGTADLQNVANALANTFNGTYYAALPHTMSVTANQPIAVSGHPAWEVEFMITYASPQGLAFTNELGAIVVADPQTGAAPAVFYTSIPGNLNEANVGTLVSSLQLTAVAPPAGASPSTPTSPGASATASQGPPAPPSPQQPGQAPGGKGGGKGH